MRFADYPSMIVGIAQWMDNNHQKVFAPNHWYECPEISVYLTMNLRRFKSEDWEFKSVRVLSMNNVIVESSKRLHGNYSRLLADLENLNKLPILFIENADTAHDGLYQRRGFIRYETLDGSENPFSTNWFKPNPNYKE